MPKLKPEKMKFKVKNPYRKVELNARKHIKLFKHAPDDGFIFNSLDHFFWETFDKIIKSDEKS